MIDSEIQNSWAQPEYFYALQPRCFLPDRLYMIFVTRDALRGVYIAGQIYDDISAKAQLQQLYPFLHSWVRQTLARRAEREEKYKALLMRSTECLSVDHRNFELRNTQLLEVTVHWRRGVLTRGGIGTLTILDAIGRRRKLILTRNQDAEVINNSLEAFFPPTKFIGRFPAKIPVCQEKAVPKPMASAISSVLFLFFAIGFLVSFVLQHVVLHAILGMINLVAAAYCIARAIRLRRGLVHFDAVPCEDAAKNADDVFGDHSETK